MIQMLQDDKKGGLASGTWWPFPSDQSCLSVPCPLIVSLPVYSLLNICISSWIFISVPSIPLLLVPSWALIIFPLDFPLSTTLTSSIINGNSIKHHSPPLYLWQCSGKYPFIWCQPFHCWVDSCQPLATCDIDSYSASSLGASTSFSPVASVLVLVFLFTFASSEVPCDTSSNMNLFGSLHYLCLSACVLNLCQSANLQRHHGIFKNFKGNTAMSTFPLNHAKLLSSM